jgi:hypothetical protein
MACRTAARAADAADVVKAATTFKPSAREAGHKDVVTGDAEPE